MAEDIHYVDFDVFCVNRIIRVADINELAEKPTSSPSFIAELLRFKRNILIGDRLLHYCSVQDEWDLGIGSEGYIILRDKKVVDEITTMIS